MASTIPYNLQFSSYANFRNPNFQRLQQMLGNARIPDATAIDIAAEDRGQRLQIFERGLAEQTRSSQEQERLGQSQIDVLMGRLDLEREQFGEFQETSDLQQERMRQEIENLTAYYQELMPKYAEMFQTVQSPAPTTAPPTRRSVDGGGGYSFISPKGITRVR